MNAPGLGSLRFPSTFLFGTATAATQIEGGCTTSDWHSFSRVPGAIASGDTPDVACNSWQHWRRDIELQQQLGMTTYRMSVEWARIEPLPRSFDVDVIDQVQHDAAGSARCRHRAR